MLKDDGGGAAMRRRRQSAVYSPGGCGCGLLLLPVIAVSIGVMFALAGLAAAALVPCFLCPVDDQCVYRGIRHGGLMHCQQTVARSAFARRLDNCIGRLPQP